MNTLHIYIYGPYTNIHTHTHIYQIGTVHVCTYINTNDCSTNFHTRASNHGSLFFALPFPLFPFPILPNNHSTISPSQAPRALRIPKSKIPKSPITEQILPTQYKPHFTSTPPPPPSSPLPPFPPHTTPPFPLIPHLTPHGSRSLIG